MMDTYFPSINNQRNAVITPYMEDPKINSYSEMPYCSNSMAMGLNQGPAHGFYSSTSNCVDSMDGRYEMAFLPQFGHSLGIQDFASELETEKIDQLGIPNGGKNSQCGGLSLSLGSKISFSSGNRSAAEMETFPNSSGLAALGGMNSNVYDPYEASVLANTGLNSRYVKAAQQLLDEVVNIRAALNGIRSNKHKSLVNNSNNNNGGSSGRSLDMSSSYGTSTTNPSRELSSVERQDLKNRSAKLLSMVEEVDERYRQYYQQMQIMVSSFDMIAGCGAAELYTALAHQTISRHFRRLRDGISDQIQVMRKNLGEEDCSSAGQKGIPRLRYVDQQLRQHRALQQLGITRHSWRPQRGLPESSVSILRAWLFEHFLHPYPKDTEKLMLARQTGLTRNQVANWFINARVRLWKPMVEEMYKEEFGDPTMDFNFSPENTSGAPKNCSFPFEDRDEDLQGSVISSNADGEQIQESNSNEISGMEMKENASKIGVESIGNAENIANHPLYPHNMILSNRVSLALELRHFEKNDCFLKSDVPRNAEDAPPMGKCRLGSPHLLHDFAVCKSDCL